MAALAWLRRLVVSIGIGGASYAIMLGIMVASIIYDRELEPIITFAFDTGRSIIGAFELIGLGQPLGTGCGQPLARTREHDPCRALHSRHHHRRHHRRYSLQLVSWRDTDRGSADCDSAVERAGHRRACCRALQLQRALAGCVRGPAAVRGLGVAGVVERTERFRRYDPGGAQVDECCTTRLLGPSLRHYGLVQHARLVSRQRTLRRSIKAERGIALGCRPIAPANASTEYRH